MKENIFGFFKNLDKRIRVLQENILGTFTISIVTFMTSIINISYKGFSLKPLPPQVNETLLILVGLPIYINVTVKALESENVVFKKFFNRNKAILSIFLLPFIVYLIQQQPAGLPNLPVLIFYFLAAYPAAIFVYMAFSATSDILNDLKEEPTTFLDQLIFATFPAAFISLIVFMSISYTLRVIGVIA